jgi:hypothetical protein
MICQNGNKKLQRYEWTVLYLPLASAFTVVFLPSLIKIIETLSPGFKVFKISEKSFRLVTAAELILITTALLSNLPPLPEGPGPHPKSPMMLFCRI